MNRATDIHTCHAECPCQTGGEPHPDFLPVENGLAAGVAAMQSAIAYRLAENPEPRREQKP